MGVIDKLGRFIFAGDDDEDDEDGYNGYGDGDDEDYVEPQQPEIEEQKEVKYRSFTNKSLAKGKKAMIPQDNNSVCIYKPDSTENSREIVDTLKENTTVLLNLEDTDDITAQRILDFTSGACYALDGKLQKISNYIFIVTPSSVEIQGNLREDVEKNFGF